MSYSNLLIEILILNTVTNSFKNTTNENELSTHE